MNVNQTDNDGDGIGDACDDDWDNDGHLNDVDLCKFTASSQTDSDQDGMGDECDCYPNDPAPRACDFGVPLAGVLDLDDLFWLKARLHGILDELRRIGLPVVGDPSDSLTGCPASWCQDHQSDYDQAVLDTGDWYSSNQWTVMLDHDDIAALIQAHEHVSDNGSVSGYLKNFFQE